MSSFQLVFTVFNLLLGLAVAEILRGLARALKIRRGDEKIRVGWLTPLLGLYVISDLVNFWMTAWAAQDAVQANYLTLILVLLIVGTYYLVATMVFPDEPKEWPDFDDWFDRESRLVITGMIAANIALAIAETVSRLYLHVEDRSADLTNFGIAISLTGITLMIALLLVKNRRVNAVILCLLILINVLSGVMGIN